MPRGSPRGGRPSGSRPSSSSSLPPHQRAGRSPSIRGRGRGASSRSGPSATERGGRGRPFSRGGISRGRGSGMGGRGGRFRGTPGGPTHEDASSRSLIPPASSSSVSFSASQPSPNVSDEASPSDASSPPRLPSVSPAAPVSGTLFSFPKAEQLFRGSHPVDWLTTWDRMPWFVALKKVESAVLVLPVPAEPPGVAQAEEARKEAFFAYFFLLGERLLLRLSEEYEALLAEDSEQRWFLQLANQPAGAAAAAAPARAGKAKKEKAGRRAQDDADEAESFGAAGEFGGPKKGTRGDTLSALSLLIQQQPLCACKWLYKLLYMISGRKKSDAAARRTWGGNCQSAVEAAFTLFDGPLILPAYRKLRSLAQQPQWLRDRAWALLGKADEQGNADQRDTEKDRKQKRDVGDGAEPREQALLQLAMLWRLEAEFKTIYATFLLSDGVSDSVIHFARRSLRLAWSLLMRKKEEEQMLLSLLVRSLGSRENQIASSASHLLAQLLVRHAPMKPVVVVYVGNFLLSHLHEALNRAATSAEATWAAVLLSLSASSRKKEKRRQRRLMERGALGVHGAQGELEEDGVGGKAKGKENEKNKRVELLGRLVTRLLRSGSEALRKKAILGDANEDEVDAADDEERGQQRERKRDHERDQDRGGAVSVFGKRMGGAKGRRFRPLPPIEVKALQMQILTLLMPAKLPDFLQGVYRAVLFFSELQFHKDTDRDVAAQVARVYLQVFTQLHRFPALLQSRLSRTKPSSSAQAVPCVPPLYTLASLNRLVRALLNGLHRALPYLPFDSASSPFSAALGGPQAQRAQRDDRNGDARGEEAATLETLFALAHTLPSMASRIVVLRLLHRLTETAQAASDRLSRVVYEHLNDPAVFAASNRAALLSLVCSLALPSSPADSASLSPGAASLSMQRTVAVCKRILQVGLAHPDPPGVAAAAALISALFVSRAKRDARVLRGKAALAGKAQTKQSRVEQLLCERERNLQADDEDVRDIAADSEASERASSRKRETKKRVQENKTDDESDKASRPPCVYDPTKRDPRYSRACETRLWELAAASAFYHPAVSTLAASTIDGACSSEGRGKKTHVGQGERAKKRQKLEMDYDEDSVVSLSTSLTHSRVLDLLAYKPRAEVGRESEKSKAKQGAEGSERAKAKSPFALGRAAAFPLDSARHWLARGEKVPPQEQFMALYFQDPFVAESEQLRRKKRTLGVEEPEEGSDEERIDESDDEKQDQLLSDEEVDNFLTEQLAAQFGADAASDEDDDVEDDGFENLEEGEMDQGGEDGEDGEDGEVDWDALSSGDEEMDDAIFGGDEGDDDPEEDSDGGDSPKAGKKRKSVGKMHRDARLERLREHVKKHSKLGELGGSFVSAEGLEDLLRG
ncbi:conserved hypothetical protein [Neospora caninum Liverpool]|uniref:CBF/Mak21 family protein n=1 Tax=Neospora caninum (strain Liverpool) TaxID=572307 RepID=F0VNK0_NEOCL|nr:conserved hypothetical protein [Neospora caninum Liverpool]CBZ55296.1 conserved hypothetical protein [Neospora caninum Liverpool]CEL70028.1 TPA: CBF/Mak21 family protein [Neospora caninum Liverpool]|eukprot:XP_003885324.1 conserved hypothetical protein [Neospora caninum Liverpool]